MQPLYQQRVHKIMKDNNGDKNLQFEVLCDLNINEDNLLSKGNHYNKFCNS